MDDINENSFKQLLYARYNGELQAAKREAKGYIRTQRHGTSRAYTREAWKTAREARRALKGFTKGDGSFERIARTKMMGISHSSPWSKYMKRADAARLDPSTDYDMTRAGRGKGFYLTREQNGETTVAKQTLRERAQAAIQRFHEAHNPYYGDDDRDPGMHGDEQFRKDGRHVTGQLDRRLRKSVRGGETSYKPVDRDDGGAALIRGSRKMRPEHREVGTTSLAQIYARSTPGQTEETITEAAPVSALTHRVTHFGKRSMRVMKNATADAASKLTARATEFAARLQQRRMNQQGKRADAQAKSQQAAASFRQR